MTAKNIVAKSWTITPSYSWPTGTLRRCFDYPNGDKPDSYQPVPTLLRTNIVAGSNVNGENNKGAYLSLYGYGFGLPSRLGTPEGARVYIGGVEVDNYRALIPSPTYEVNQAREIIVQVGALTGLTAGVNYPVTVVVNGVESVNPTVNGSVVLNNFMIQPGDFYFVSKTGNDSTGVVNDISNPYRYIQNISQTDLGGGNLRVDAILGVFANLKPGDTIVALGGDYTGDRVGYEGRWCRFFNGSCVKPSAPTGVVGHGYVHITRYPGDILAHDPDVVHYNCGTDGGTTITRTGGILGTHSDSALRGYGQYVSVSGLEIECGTGGSSDGGFVDMQNSGTTWRVIGCKFGPWLNAGEVLNDSATGGVGFRSVVMFNYIHDIEGNSSKQNHGIYFGGVEGGTGLVAGSKYNEVAYNWIVNCSGGSSLQFNFNANNSYLSQAITNIANNGSGGVRVTVPTMVDAARGNDGTFNVPSGGYMPTGAWVRLLNVGGATYCNGLFQITYVDPTHFDIQGLSYDGSHPYTSGGTMADVSHRHLENIVHHNYIDNAYKYGINFAPGTLTGKAWNNIVINIGNFGLRSQPSDSTAPEIDLRFTHNIVYNVGHSVTEMECNLTTGTLLYQHNIFVNGPDTSASFGSWRSDYNGVGADPNNITVYDGNLYFDTRGLITTKQTGDTNGFYADPLFTDLAQLNFTLQSGSPALGAASAAESFAVADDFYGVYRPETGTGAPSGDLNDIGAMQGVGT
jgi:hypothetical protein